MTVQGHAHLTNNSHSHFDVFSTLFDVLNVTDTGEHQFVLRIKKNYYYILTTLVDNIIHLGVVAVCVARRNTIKNFFCSKIYINHFSVVCDLRVVVCFALSRACIRNENVQFL